MTSFTVNKISVCIHCNKVTPILENDETNVGITIREISNYCPWCGKNQLMKLRIDCKKLMRKKRFISKLKKYFKEKFSNNSMINMNKLYSELDKF